MTLGRPLKFKDAETLQAAIDAYFNSCWTETPLLDKSGKALVKPDGSPYTYRNQHRPYTITGLALDLNVDRETLLHYQEKEAFFDTVSRAKLKIQNHAEESLWIGKIATGIIFNLTNNYGWRNKQETDVTSKGESIVPEATDIDIDEIAKGVAAQLKAKKIK